MKRGRKFTFHGAFSKKASARKKEKRVHGFILERKIRKHKRYIVVKKK